MVQRLGADIKTEAFSVSFKTGMVSGQVITKPFHPLRIERSSIGRANRKINEKRSLDDRNANSVSIICPGEGAPNDN